MYRKIPRGKLRCMQTSNVVALVGMVIALLGVMDSALQRYKRANTAEYAAQRDFEHLKRNQEQLKATLEEILNENEELKINLTEVKVQMNFLLNVKANAVERGERG